MTLKKPLFVLCVVVMAAFVVGLAAPAWANVYASSLKVTGDKSFSYILNEDATAGVQIQVWQVGGGMVYSEDLGVKGKGVHNYTWSGAGGVVGNSYQIKIVAAATGYGGWTKISDDSNTALCHWLPRGVVVNQDQRSADFGQIYIGNSQGGTDHLGTNTPTGIYKVNPDGTANGWGAAGVDWGTAAHRLKVALGADDNHLYMADVYDDTAYEISPDLQSSIKLNDSSNLSNYGASNAQWVRAIVVTGSQAAGNRKIYLCDSNYYDTEHKGLVMYDLGANSRATPGDKGTQYIGPSYFTYYPYDVERDAAGNWYMNNYRATAGQAPFLMKFMDGTPPINTPAWEASNQYTYGMAISINEKFGWVAGVNYNTGMVYVFNKETGALISSFDSGTRGEDLAFDAAGNIYVADAYDEYTRIWSPGGANSFTTTSYFTFDVVPEPSAFVALLAGLPGLLIFKRRRN